MKILETHPDGVSLRLNFDEVVALNNALNESLEILEDWEYQTRMGVTKIETQALLKALAQIRIP